MVAVRPKKRSHFIALSKRFFCDCPWHWSSANRCVCCPREIRRLLLKRPDVRDYVISGWSGGGNRFHLPHAVSNSLFHVGVA
jgi:hypothetical protein